MAKNSRLDQVGEAYPSIYEFPGYFYIFFGVRDAWGREIYNSLGNQSPESGVMCSANCLVLKEIAVRKAGGT